jgi:lycopene beta-cyclase
MGADQGQASTDADVILVGGGLSSCLIALWLAKDQPGTRIVVLEAGDLICGNHIWSFHETDLSPQDFRRLEPVISHVWPGQKVAFPSFERVLSTRYVSIASESLREAVYALQGIEIRDKTLVDSLQPAKVVLANGKTLSAPCVIDARGFAPHAALKLGYQKFLGQELELEQQHGEQVPTIMDACVAQFDGYRFVYVLPLSSTRLLVEDTRYSDGGNMDDNAFREAIQAYAAEKGWVVRDIVREERGVLPITLAEDVDRFWHSRMSGAAPVGLRAGLFQPTTGYSLPEAVRVANIVANDCSPLTSETVLSAVHAHARKRSRDQTYYRLLNRMLFQAAKPDERYLVLRRFYGLPQGLIERFYAGKLTTGDKLRILAGKPPVPIRKAFACISETQALAKS